MFRINYTDPWIEGDDKRTSRSINIQVGKDHIRYCGIKTEGIETSLCNIHKQLVGQSFEALKLNEVLSSKGLNLSEDRFLDESCRIHVGDFLDLKVGMC